MKKLLIKLARLIFKIYGINNRCVVDGCLVVKLTEEGGMDFTKYDGSLILDNTLFIMGEIKNTNDLIKYLNKRAIRYEINKIIKSNKETTKLNKKLNKYWVNANPVYPKIK